MPQIKLVVFDMAGTTINDVIDGVPLVLRSYDEAFKTQGISVSMKVLNENRGRDKWAVIKELGREKAPIIYEEFLGNLLENAVLLKEIDGTSSVFEYLHEKDVKVQVAEAIIEKTGWEKNGLIDGWVCSEMTGASRPDPAMILYAMRRFGIEVPSQTVKVDDTVNGIEEGLNAGVVTFGVLTGTQGVHRLSQAKPRSILKTIIELPDYLEKNGLL
jgi:HAD superfamily hydrolase (TIGR01509 family)